MNGVREVDELLVLERLAVSLERMLENLLHLLRNHALSRVCHATLWEDQHRHLRRAD
jgi:hypothetical protein